MDPEAQAGTDREAIKEQARQAMLRAQAGHDASTDAEVEDDDTDEVADASADDVESPDADEDADEADSDVEDEEDDAAEDDGDSADDDAEVVTPSGKGKRKKLSKQARLHKRIEELEAKLASQSTSVSEEVERALAAKAESDQALREMQAAQAEDGKRIKQVRDYVHRLRGTDQELDALTREIASADDLDPLALTEEQRKDLRGKKARVNQILSARDIVDLTAEYADNDLRDRVGGILAEFAKSLPGVDRDFHEKLKFGPAIQHVYDAGLAVGKADAEKAQAAYEKRIADLEGKLLSAKTRKSPPLGRVADGGTSAAPAPKAKPLDQMSPTERVKAMGMIGTDGKLDPDFRQKVRSGLIKLVG